MTVRVTRMMLATDHDNQKWLVLKGEIEGYPQVTKTRSINTAALASGAKNLETEKAQLIADVEEYLARWLAVQQAVIEL